MIVTIGEKNGIRNRKNNENLNEDSIIVEYESYVNHVVNDRPDNIIENIFERERNIVKINEESLSAEKNNLYVNKLLNNGKTMETTLSNKKTDFIEDSIIIECDEAKLNNRTSEKRESNNVKISENEESSTVQDCKKDFDKPPIFESSIKATVEGKKSVFLNKPPKPNDIRKKKLKDNCVALKIRENLEDKCEDLKETLFHNKYLETGENNKEEPIIQKELKESADKKKNEATNIIIRRVDSVIDANKYREKKVDYLEENDSKIIFSSDDEKEINKKEPPRQIVSQNKDINKLLQNFVCIRLESIKKPKKVKTDSQEERLPSFSSINKKRNLNFNNEVFVREESNKNLEAPLPSPLPFSARMKQLYKGASIFNN